MCNRKEYSQRSKYLDNSSELSNFSFFQFPHNFGLLQARNENIFCGFWLFHYTGKNNSIVAKKISLDIQNSPLKNIDISGFFPNSEVHAIFNGTMKPTLDQILPELPRINLAKNTPLQVDSFETFGMLDLAHNALIESPYWQSKKPELKNRKKKIILAEPLFIPFGALDICTLEPIISEKKYPDLFTRNLTSKLRLKRFSRHSKFFWRRHKKVITRTLASFFLILVPIIFFIKFSVESGYNKLLHLTNAKNISELQALSHSAKTDFERADFLFLPFSWIPLDTVNVVKTATQ